MFGEDYLARPLTVYVYWPRVRELLSLTGHSQWTPASDYRCVNRRFGDSERSTSRTNRRDLAVSPHRADRRTTL